MAARKKDTGLSELDAKRKERAEQVIAMIAKATKQKPLGTQEGTWPHIPSGALTVDNLIGGQPLSDGSGMICPGYPRGRMIEIFGPESSGKCLTQDTYISTGLGLLTLGELIESIGDIPSCSARIKTGLNIPLTNRYGGHECATAITWNNRRRVLGILASDGTLIRSTLNHPHLILQDGYHVWRKTKDLSPGDWLVVQPHAPCFGNTTLEADQAYLLGILVADGSFGDTRVSVTNDHPGVIQVLREVGPILLGVQPKEYTAGGSLDLHFSSKELVGNFYKEWGLSPCVDSGKHFPVSMRTLTEESTGQLLAGYLDCEASYCEGVFEVTSASHLLLRQVQLLLRGFGVFSTVHPKQVSQFGLGLDSFLSLDPEAHDLEDFQYSDTPYWRLFVTGGDLGTLQCSIPFRRNFGFPPVSTRLTRTVPGIQHLVKALYEGASATTRAHSRLAGDLLTGASQSASALLTMLDQVDWVGSNPILVDHLRELARYEYVKVEAITEEGDQPTFDLVVPGTHSFIAEGRVNHNTTLALASVVSVQKAGGLAMFLDYENALHHGYAKAIGVNFSPDKLLYYAPSTLEEGMKMLYIAIRQKLDLVVLDSVAAMVPAKELEKNIDDAAAIGALARAMSTILPKMVQWLKEAPTLVTFLNQTRSLISSNSNAGEDNTAGGKAVKFYASLRLKLTRLRSDVVERPDPVTLKKKKIPYGNLVDVKVVKNKMAGTQGHKGTIFIRYGAGVDEYLSAIEGAIPRKIITQSASTYNFKGETFKGRDRLRSFLIDNPKAFEEIKAKVTEALISETPKVVEEVEDEDIISDMNRELGDDDILESDEGVEDIEHSVEESLEAS